MKNTLLTAASAIIFTVSLNAQYQPDAPTEEEKAQTVVGHNGLKYQVNRNWAKTSLEEAPIINAHAMVEGSDGLFYLVTDHPDNAVIVFQPDGTFVKAIGKNLRGGHGIDVIYDEENDRELLVHVDSGWEFTAEGKAKFVQGSINLLTKEGDLVRTLPSPRDMGIIKGNYGPCDVAITADNEILIVNGYGTDHVFQFTIDGKLIRMWGGRSEGPESIENGHGISIDDSQQDNPILWVSSRNQNSLKRFTLEGKYLDIIELPGAYAGQAVFHGDYIYSAVCWSNDDMGKKANRSGFVVVLDRTTHKVISAPGGAEPVYQEDGTLTPLKQQYKTLRHGHDLMVDKQGNIFVGEWNAGCRYPIKLELIKE